MIRIQSSITINVTPGLQYTDLTNKDAHIPDRLKIAPKWTNRSVLITQGVGEYPNEIVEWPTVKALVKDKILTIAGYTEEEKKETPVVEDVKPTTKTTKKKTLEEVVEG